MSQPNEDALAHSQFDTESPAVQPEPAPADPADKEAEGPVAPVDLAGPSSAELALALRLKAVETLSDLRESVPDHIGDIAFGALNGDLDCAIAILKPRG